MSNINRDAFMLARERGQQVVLHTPTVPSSYLSELFTANIVLKAENLQRTGAFKIRGGMNKLAALGKRANKGVVAGSAGNHAQGLALAAATHGVKCEIFVPKGASLTKIAACRHYGATVLEGGENVEIAVRSAMERASETGMAFCHPYDDEDVVAGQGTLGLELLEDIDDLETVIVPLGGGGLLSGTAIAIKQQRPKTRVIGVQIEGCDPYVSGRIPAESITTLADGIAVKQPGVVTKPLIEKWVDDVVSVEENLVADAMVMLMERSKLSANIIELQHVREGIELHVRETMIRLVLETRGADHAAEIRAGLENLGYLTEHS